MSCRTTHHLACECREANIDRLVIATRRLLEIEERSSLVSTWKAERDEALAACNEIGWESGGSAAGPVSSEKEVVPNPESPAHIAGSSPVAGLLGTAPPPASCEPVRLTAEDRHFIACVLLAEHHRAYPGTIVCEEDYRAGVAAGLSCEGDRLEPLRAIPDADLQPEARR